MADISQGNWTALDDDNDSSPPLGAPEGMAPSGVNDTMRQMAGATKRFWERINGVIKATNLGNAYTYTPEIAAPALVDGEAYTFRIDATNTGPVTLDVGVGGSQPVVRSGATDTRSLSAGDFVPGMYYTAIWDSLSAHFVLLNSPLAGDMASISAELTAAILAEDDSTSAVIKADISSVSTVIKADIGSVSAVIKADISSVSAAIKTDIGSVSSAINTAYTASDRSTSAAVRTAIGNQLALSYASFTGTNPPSNIGISPNVLSVSRSGVGVYRVRFSPFLDVTRGLAVSGMSEQGVVLVNIVTASAVKLTVWDLATVTPISGGYVSLVVFGNS